MPHRDDREALDAKLEAQGRELAETKEELERLRAANLRKATELERLRVSQTQSQGQPPDGSVGGSAWPRAVISDALRRQVGVLVIATSLLVGGLSFSAIHLAAVQHRCGHAAMAAPVAAVTAPVHATFEASIARAVGLTAHEAGEPCRVDATFLADGRARVHAVSALTVTCGDETLYAPDTTALADAIGIAWSSETDGHVRYELAFAAGATRLDSWDGRAVLAAPGSRIELALAPLSDEVALALTDGTAERVMVRSGHVTTSTSVAVGTACTVARRPAILEGFASRVVVRCGDHTLYGADGTGYTYPSDDARLVIDDETSARDGDARLTLDLVRGAVHLDDGEGLAQSSLDITLDPTGPTTDI